MAFIKRLGFYLFGLSIGLVFLTIFFKNKSEQTGVEFCYFPNCRTLKDIRSKTLSFSEEVDMLMKNNAIDSTAIAFFLNEGTIDFGSSKTKTNPCKTYVIEAEIDGQTSIMQLKNCEEKAIVERIDF